MLESIKQYAEALTGLTEVPRKRARRIATSLSKQGVIPTEQILSVASGIVERSRENRRRITEVVVTQVRKQAGAIGLATSDEIERLRRRILALEGAGSGAKTASPAKRASKPAVRKTTTVKRPKRAAAASKPKAKTASKAKARTTRPRKRASATRRR